MPKFSIEVQWHYKSFDYASVEVEADTLGEAKVKALEHVEGHGLPCPLEGQIYDGEYAVNDDECEEVK